MARKKLGDNIAAIGNVTGISVKVNIEGGNIYGGDTLEQVPVFLNRQ